VFRTGRLHHRAEHPTRRRQLPGASLIEPIDLPARTAVLIVGGGPIGLLTSILLSAQGVENVVVERRPDVQAAPAAHVVNARTFEILRAAGLDMRRIEDACRPPSDGWVRWVTSLTGDELGSVPFERQHRIESLFDVTPTPLRNLSQHRLEPILRDHTKALAAAVEWVGATQDPTGVVSTLRDGRTGRSQSISSRYLVAADGAGSSVRRWLGIAMDGPQRLQSILSIHVEADLRSLVKERPATLYWIVDPDIGGAYVAHDIDGTWVYMHPWNPDAERREDYTEERCAEVFERGIGAPIESLRVRSITPWTLSCQVAERYREGRVFLVGDAAHRFPPSGGMGLNTGAVDGQNLAWKLAAVEHGWADARILDSYDAERRGIARTNADQSLRNAVKLFDVARALGTDSDPAVRRSRYVATLASAEGRDSVRVAAEGQAEHFDMIGLQLGFRYDAAARLVIDDGTALAPPADAVRDYVPTTRPGARLPHAWIERAGRRISTLDLVPLDRFVLLTSSPAWAAAGDQLTSPAVPLDVVRIGRDALDPEQHWARVSELAESGAVLVRPDQHVGWRAFAVSSDPVASLRTALSGLGVVSVPS
jgi:2-polyprenyl-6-methoxyphenol hydroxylase-like FAD-dependent oxidoreductase